MVVLGSDLVALVLAHLEGRFVRGDLRLQVCHAPLQPAQ